jgi:O-6-methylguanine DNA methyltransferase
MKTKSEIQTSFNKNFKDRVQEIVKNIPHGSVLSYKEVAIRAGAVGAARAVGTIMSNNTDKTIPCHRVVKSDGSIGGYNGLRTSSTGTLAKIELLKKEGVKFTKSNKVISTF